MASASWDNARQEICDRQERLNQRQAVLDRTYENLSERVREFVETLTRHGEWPPEENLSFHCRVYHGDFTLHLTKTTWTLYEHSGGGYDNPYIEHEVASDAMRIRDVLGMHEAVREVVIRMAQYLMMRNLPLPE